MIIVAGKLYVAADVRAAYLAQSLEIIELARAAPGCLDFHLSPDPLEEDRMNVFEAWESLAALEAFRGSGPSGEQQAAILDADVKRYGISSVGDP